MGSFLDNLKKAVDNGEFNSEAAKKINEIERNADKAKGLFLSEEDKEMLKKLKTPPVVTEEEVLAANNNYVNEMTVVTRKDEINKLLVTLIEIEDMVKMSIDDMFSHVKELEDKFATEFEGEDPVFGDLHQKIEDIKLKYSNFIIN
jgi:hypothetical protein